MKEIGRHKAAVEKDAQNAITSGEISHSRRSHTSTTAFATDEISVTLMPAEDVMEDFTAKPASNGGNFETCWKERLVLGVTVRVVMIGNLVLETGRCDVTLL